jgi:hypothetical protein
MAPFGTGSHAGASVSIPDGRLGLNVNVQRTNPCADCAGLCAGMYCAFPFRPRLLRVLRFVPIAYKPMIPYRTEHRRGGRAAEGGGLLNRCALSRCTVGSNPIPSSTSIPSPPPLQ